MSGLIGQPNLACVARTMSVLAAVQVQLNGMTPSA